ncbi:MAG: energy-dependent translational throttle protein EttA [Candidatus Hydrogenedentota bacterium]
MADQIIYTMHRVGKIYPPKKQVLKDISLSYFYGAKIGVLGYNGSGKSTLLRIMAGVEKEYEGETSIVKGYSVGFLEQEPQLDDSKTVKEVVEEGLGNLVGLVKDYEAVCAKLGEEMTPEEMEKLIDKQSALQEKIDAADAWDLDSRLEMAMDALRCPSGDTPVKVISGGERRRVALCRLLLTSPDILLLDEPTNHLDAESVQWLEKHLHDYAGTVIAVTHDRYFLDNVAGWILELDRGEGVPFKGNYTSWLEQKQERLRVEEKSESKRQLVLSRELEWIKMSPSGRRAKGKARINAYNDLLNQMGKEKIDKLEIFIPPGPRLGDVAIEFAGVAKSYSEKLLYENLTFTIPPGGIVGIIGPNGAGKTTLFRMIVDQEKPDAGSIKVGQTVKIGYVDQSRDALDGKKTVWEEISGGADILEMGPVKLNSRAYVSQFNFTGTDQQKPVSVLSGGERNRVHLAKMLKSGANLLLMDEPTNDLDVNAIRALEEALENFAGCAVIISHDRWFLDRVVTHILAFEGESGYVWFEGNYSEYDADRHKRLGADADRPHRIKYKKLAKSAR